MNNNILIIDDNQDLADMLELILQTEGYQVIKTYNGIDGMAAFHQAKFNTVILDVKLPDINSFEIFHTVHAKDPAINIIMITGYRIEQLLSSITNDNDIIILREQDNADVIVETVLECSDRSIVLIEANDPDLPSHVKNRLSSHSLKTYHATNHQEAIEQLSLSDYDVLILDLSLPVTYSANTIYSLHKLGADTKTVILTPQTNDPGSPDPLKSPAVTGCLFKPFSPDKLLNLINK